MKKIHFNKANLKRGSVTVFVTLILVPCVFFTGFIVDLARLKLFSNQAVMAADNYGAAALAEYDGYLYTLYGLFAISQNGKLDISATNQEILRTFKDGESSSDVFMPYANAQDMQLSIEMIQESAMSNPDILESQISDYMKYRIIKTFVEQTDGGIFDALDQMEHLGDNLKAAKAVEKFKEECEDQGEAAQEYYNNYSYVTKNNESHCQNDIDELNKKIDDYNRELENLKSVKSETAETEEEKEDLAERIMAAQLRVDVAKKEVNKKAEDIDSKYKRATVGAKLSQNTLIKKINSFEEKKEKTLSEVNKEGVSEDFKQGVSAEIHDTYPLDSNEIYTLTDILVSTYKRLNSDLSCIGADGTNEASRMEEDYHGPIEKDLGYIHLKSLFGEDDNESEATKNAKDGTTKKKLNDKTNDKIDELNKDEETTARDIPDAYKSIGGSSFILTSDAKHIFSNLMRLFSHRNRIPETLIADFYSMEYDYGMFTNRTTEVTNKTVSLVGYELSSDVNYSYLAEIEYLISGHAGEGSASKNLTEVKNRILAYRMMMNYISTYMCVSLSNTIRAASSIGVIAPIVFALNQGMRVCIALYESSSDWDKLKNGEKVKLYKKNIEDFNGIQNIISLVDPDTTTKPGVNAMASNKVIQLDYVDYTKIILFFFTDANERINRTSNLIEINVNYSASGYPVGSFSMDKAYTAVNSTFKCRLPFAVMPKGFAKKATPDNYGAIEKFERNYYTYTVTRGY